MRHTNRRTGLVLLAVALLVSACGKAAVEEETTGNAARIEHVAGTDLNRVILTPEAAKRLDIQTALVRDDSDGTPHTVIPYAAVLYDANGDTWTYTNPEGLVFVRQDIVVDRIDGDVAVLSEGPRDGTRVVIVGASELWGVEYGGIEED